MSAQKQWNSACGRQGLECLRGKEPGRTRIQRTDGTEVVTHRGNVSQTGADSTRGSNENRQEPWIFDINERGRKKLEIRVEQKNLRITLTFEETHTNIEKHKTPDVCNGAIMFALDINF